jgi:hypothetical protein
MLQSTGKVHWLLVCIAVLGSMAMFFAKIDIAWKAGPF